MTRDACYVGLGEAPSLQGTGVFTLIRPGRFKDELTDLRARRDATWTVKAGVARSPQEWMACSCPHGWALRDLPLIVLGDEAPTPFETTAHGSWIATGSGEAAHTFVAFIGNAENKPPSRLKVVGALTYDAGADTWRGPFKIEMVDADGQQAFADCGTMSGTRITVERLSQGSFR